MRFSISRIAEQLYFAGEWELVGGLLEAGKAGRDLRDRDDTDVKSRVFRGSKGRGAMSRLEGSSDS